MHSVFRMAKLLRLFCFTILQQKLQFRDATQLLTSNLQNEDKHTAKLVWNQYKNQIKYGRVKFNNTDARKARITKFEIQ